MSATKETEEKLGKEMTFLEHLDELKTRITRILITIAAISIFSFTFRIERFDLLGTILYLPFPALFNNLTTQILLKVMSDLLPEYVKIIQVAPGQAIIAQIYVSIFLGLIFGMPVIVRETWGFISPGLYSHEKRMITGLTIPISALFAAGVLFSYIFVTPIAIDFLYQYGLALKAATFVTIEDFIVFVLMFLVAMGVSFQLPIIMYLVTKLGLVQPRFWKENFRYALLAMIIFGAVITPDGSGITMWLVALPMVGLYGGAYLVIRARIKPKG